MMSQRRMAALACMAGIAISGAVSMTAAAQSGPHPMRLDRSPPRTGAAATMLYYGGPVISTVKVEAVFWTGAVASATRTGIPAFLSSLANSTYTDQLAEYSTKGLTGVGGHPGTNQTISRGSLLGTVTINPKNTSKTLTDANVRAELQHQITIGKLPNKDANTLYMVYFPSGYTITLGTLRSCSSFGAYHTAGPAKVSPATILYSVEPDCGGGFSSQTVVSSHEFAEAVSDAIPTPGSNPAYPQAWNTSNGYEIGDLCEGHNTTLKSAKATYTVQEVFDAKTNACATGSFTSP